MTKDNNLMAGLLLILMKRELSLTEGDIILVQPHIEGMAVENPVVVPGYDHEQIDYSLRRLCQVGFVDNGGVAHPLIGIYFSHITPAGHLWLNANRPKDSRL